MSHVQQSQSKHRPIFYRQCNANKTKRALYHSYKLLHEQTTQSLWAFPASPRSVRFTVLAWCNWGTFVCIRNRVAGGWDKEPPEQYHSQLAAVQWPQSGFHHQYISSFLPCGVQPPPSSCCKPKLSLLNSNNQELSSVTAIILKSSFRTEGKYQQRAC